MKIKQFGILITLLMVFLSCSKDEEFTIISPTNISFVHEDGSKISINECINPNGKYAVLIETTSKGNGKYKIIVVEYTVNGALYSMTFLKEGAQICPITLAAGQNTAQISGSALTSNIQYIAQGDFELVE